MGKKIKNLYLKIKFIIKFFIYKFTLKSNDLIFTKIYSDSLWGCDINHNYFSGPGSHDKKVLKIYLKDLNLILH